MLQQPVEHEKCERALDYRLLSCKIGLDPAKLPYFVPVQTDSFIISLAGVLFYIYNQSCLPGDRSLFFW